MTSIVSVYATFGTEEEARRIGREVVDERLAACVNILGSCLSIYRWEEGVMEEREVAAIFKTGADRAQRLIARICDLHSYDVPAAVAWPIIHASAGYAKWVEENSAVT